jgi:hypothetical protein
LRGVFGSREEWLVETVRYFLERPGETLVIRAHPAELSVSQATRDGVERVLRHHFGPAIFERPNIVFIPPSEPTRSYHLLRFVRAGIVENGTLGLELIYKGIPVIVAGRPGYAAQPFGRTFATREEYFGAFSRTETLGLEQAAHRDLLLKYVYYSLFVALAPIRGFDHVLAPRLNAPIATADEILREPFLNRIAETILGNGRDFGDLRLPEARDDLNAFLQPSAAH